MEIYEAKRQLQQQQSSKSSRSPSPPPELEPEASINDTFRSLPRTPPPTRAGPPPSPPVPTHPVAPVAPEPSAPLPLLPCQVCGRTFVPESLAKHVKICEKMTVKKRKTFDSSRQRREGTDLEQYLPKNFGLPENSPFLEKSPPNTAKVTPKPKSQSVRSAITKPMAELQKCPYCGRAFGPRAFERHVEWCADKAKILPAAPTAPPPHLADAKLRLHARTQYKAPPVRTRRSSQSRDKASNSRSASVDSSRGVSPPREYGDYKPGRTRASESLSSNDCQDDLSPHIPVIRNSRNTQNNSSGDANVKARQARLARDISNSRKPQESHPHSPVQQSKTDSNINKKNLECRNKLKNKLSVKRQQQLKKLEEIANKFNERTMNKRDNIKTTDKKIVKSQIPIPTKIIRNEPISETNKQTNDKSILEQCTKESKPANDIKGKSFKQVLEESISKVNTKNIKTATVKLKEKFNTTKKPIKLAKEWSISLDSLEECQLSNNEKKCHSIGINTELLCPCIPCVIYENPEQNKSNKRKQNNETNALIKINNNVQEPKIELLYKNLAVGSSSDLQIKVDSEEKLNFQNSQSLLESPSITENKIYHTHLLYTESNMTDQIIGATSRYSETLRKVDNGNINSNENNARKIRDFSTEHFENNYEQDNSSCEMLDDSIENKFTNYNDNENNIGRHGSSDTYTKFTENPHDLEEFINITDTMITNQTIEQKHAMEMDVETLITPKTNSIEAIDTIVLDVSLKQGKCNFCDTLEELKDNLNKLLDDSNNNELLQLDQNSIKEVNEKRKVCDMEHITVYELKFQEQKQIEKANILIDGSAAFKLPAIFENNKPERKLTCNKKRMQKIYKPKRKYIMLGNQSRNNTFIVNNHEDSDNLSVTSEAPPLKLPRIELKRLDDNYDPFASAAKQMKELMSSDTNIPQKLKNSSKDPNRTLPILRPTKEKAHSYLRITDNTKMMKDTLNKTYQKTPTLQRMKSFGSSNNDNTNSTIGSRCSSFRLNRNDKKPSPKLNTTFTKSSKENVGTTDKMYFNRNNSLNRSFSSYTTSNYSTPKPKDKIPKIATSMYHSFQRNTIKQPVKLDKIKRPEEKTDFVNLDIILTDDNSSMTDSNYIDPRLINENDNLPINVNTILNNPDIISSMESLLTTENLPAKFESFNTSHQNNNACNDVVQSKFKFRTENNNIKSTAPTIDDLSAQYDKIMTSLEQSIASKTSIRDDDSLCEDFDLEEFMTSFDEEINRQKVEKRTCSSTTRVVKQSELVDSNRTSEFNSISPSPKVVKSSSNGMIPVNKSISLNFSSNNIVSESLFPSSVKRSTSLLDSIQKKNTAKADSAKNRNKVDQLEQDIMQSLKDLNKFYEPERNDNNQTHKESANYKTPVHNGTTKRDTRVKSEKKIKKNENVTNENYTPNGKTSNDSAYSSLNRISPSKLSLCNSKESNGVTSLEQIPAGSDSSGSHKEDVRSVSSEEFLAMERSAEIDEPHSQLDMHTSYKELDCNAANEKRSSSRTSWNHGRSGSGGGGGQLSSSGSEASLQRREVVAPRFSRFCHECGSKFPVDTAKFCIECGVRRLLV